MINIHKMNCCLKSNKPSELYKINVSCDLSISASFFKCINDTLFTQLDNRMKIKSLAICSAREFELLHKYVHFDVF